jgi:hypothetical protein
MARLSEALSVKFVESNRHKPGMYCDGGGLYLRVAPGGSKQWVFRYVAPDPSHERGYRLRDMGLGSVDDMTLANGRTRSMRRNGSRRSRGTFSQGSAHCRSTRSILPSC